MSRDRLIVDILRVVGLREKEPPLGEKSAVLDAECQRQHAGRRTCQRRGQQQRGNRERRDQKEAT